MSILRLEVFDTRQGLSKGAIAYGEGSSEDFQFGLQPFDLLEESRGLHPYPSPAGCHFSPPRAL